MGQVGEENGQNLCKVQEQDIMGAFPKKYLTKPFINGMFCQKLTTLTHK